MITDSNVGPLYGSRASATFAPGSVDLVTIPAGEIHKTRETWGAVTDHLIALGCGRDTTIVALGGGVVGDLAGFVAATYMRGLPVVQVPTSLLAMIDAAVGGKTGVDTPAGKNMVGSFHPPAGVIADTQALATLAVEHLRTGFAEAIKHGVIADEQYFEIVLGYLPRILSPPFDGGAELFAAVVGSIEIKASIVAQDVREAGVRKVLNFGHTVGHAIETLSGYCVAHGEAVAIGMALESTIAERAGIAEPDTAKRVRHALAVAGLPAARPPELTVDSIVHSMRGDKKSRAGRIEYALPLRIGAMAGGDSGWTVNVDENLVREVLE